MNLEDLKSQQADVQKRGQEMVNEQLRLEGEYRALGALITKMEGTPVPVTVTPVSDTEEDTANGDTPTE